ncbi:unnamed protein product [Owenia fusiformis]|uniref:Uncharacterized protein n=1 Tax=Owenia fusiformis TaxID=6347 RepID=A0A8J1UK89_OWEFU|nr:unnamed protein product [Owenia fusiformis]
MISQRIIICLTVVSVVAMSIALVINSHWTRSISKVNRPAPAKRAKLVHVGHNGFAIGHDTLPRRMIYLKEFEVKNRNENLIFYSRSPKCGSTTMIAVMRAACKYSGKYNVTYIEPVPRKKDLKTLSKKKKYVSTHFIQESPKIVIGHFAFFDFIELGYKQPLFIDIVRDPVERWISKYYYFLSSPPYIKLWKLTERDRTQTFEECFQIWKKKTGCVGKNTKQTAACLKKQPYNGCKGFKEYHSFYASWFSGKYIQPSQISYEKAKANIERFYAFVGLTEHFNETVRAMEKVLPRFTDELSRAYNNRTMEHVRNKSPNKKRPSNETIAVMKEYQANDYDFYRFISQRFYSHLKRLGIQIT